MSDSIHKKMAAILAEFPAVTKDRLQPQARYNYRGIDDALRELNPLLSKHGVYLQLVDLVPTFMDAGASKSGNSFVRCVVVGKVRFTSSDGTFTEASLVGEGVDTGDKALMKAQANGLKYVLWYTFCVPTDEKKDSEAFDDPDTGSTPSGGGQKKTKAKKTDGGTPSKANGTVVPFVPSVVTPAASAPASPGEMSTEAQLMLSVIAGCKDGPALLGIREQVRAFCRARDAKDKERQAVTDNFVSRQQAFGV
jgi:hypothetical protein